MNPSDLAIVAVTAVSLADGYWHHKFRMSMSPRVRVVNPVKAPQPAPGAAASKAPAGDDERHSILDLPRPA